MSQNGFGQWLILINFILSSQFWSIFVNFGRGSPAYPQISWKLYESVALMILVSGSIRKWASASEKRQNDAIKFVTFAENVTLFSLKNWGTLYKAIHEGFCNFEIRIGKRNVPSMEQTNVFQKRIGIDQNIGICFGAPCKEKSAVKRKWSFSAFSCPKSSREQLKPLPTEKPSL